MDDGRTAARGNSLAAGGWPGHRSRTASIASGALSTRPWAASRAARSAGESATQTAGAAAGRNADMTSLTNRS